MEDFISHQNVHRLMHAYATPSDVDFFVAANMEFPLVGSLLGPTSHCYVREQFQTLRDADRFFYTRPTEFTRPQLEAIRQMSLSHVLCATADSPDQLSLPTNVF